MVFIMSGSERLGEQNTYEINILGLCQYNLTQSNKMSSWTVVAMWLFPFIDVMLGA